MEPIALISDYGTGKTHLLTGLCVAGCRQKRCVQFATAAALVNKLVEAKQQLKLRRVLARCERYDLIAIDEVGQNQLPNSLGNLLIVCFARRSEDFPHRKKLRGLYEFSTDFLDSHTETF